MIFQEKPFGEAEISWIGEKGSVVSMPAHMHDAFAALQSCIHYVQQHFASDVLQVSRRPLGQVRCAYSGACSVEVDRGHSQACKSEPWKSQTDEPFLKCVYQVGVEAFYHTIAKQTIEPTRYRTDARTFIHMPGHVSMTCISLSDSILSRAPSTC